MANHTQDTCRYCGVKRDKRGITQHEMSHPEYTPRDKSIMSMPTKKARLEAVKKRVRTSSRARLLNRTTASALPAQTTSMPDMPTAPPEIAAMLSGRIRVPRELLMDAYEAFPTDPFKFSAFAYLMAPTETEVEEIINLKTAMQMIDLRIQAIGGWEEEEEQPK